MLALFDRPTAGVVLAAGDEVQVWALGDAVYEEVQIETVSLSIVVSDCAVPE
jgi:type IV secretory pathway VirB9-like protein